MDMSSLFDNDKLKVKPRIAKGVELCNIWKSLFYRFSYNFWYNNYYMLLHKMRYMGQCSQLKIISSMFKTYNNNTIEQRYS